ncbi:MAG: hypothetical protein ACTSSG_07100 [Candidatus Heimdallarchaeaceae archaeon]
MKKIQLNTLLIILCFVFLICHNTFSTEAAVGMFDETWYDILTPYGNEIQVALRVVVWSNQHVELYAKYFTPDNDVIFDELEVWVRGRYWENTWTYVETGIDEIFLAYVDKYGDANQQMWENGQIPLDIIGGLKMKISGVVQIATICLTVFNCNGYGIALCSDLQLLDALQYALQRGRPSFH